MRWALFFVVFVAAWFLYRYYAAPYYQGLPTTDFDGTQFTPKEPMAKKTQRDVWKWRMTSRRIQWPVWVDYPERDKPPAHVDGKELRVSFVNHSTVLLQTRSLNILIDPIWSNRASPLSFMGPKRVHAPGIAWNDLPKIDVVTVSHSHYDHLDIPTVKKLVKRDNPLFIVPLGVDATIRRHAPKVRIKALNWDQSYKVNNDLTVYAEAVQHWSARTLWDRNKSLWMGVVFDLPDGKIYYPGDTGYASGKVFRDTYKKHGAMRFAIIPIGAYEPRWFMKDSHVNPEESVKIFKDVHAKHALSVHWGTFQLTDEGINEPVEFLDRELKEAEIPAEEFRALKPGQSWIVP